MTQNNSLKTKKLVAITGGIGSGKSTALSIIKEEGFFVISCDEITKKTYEDSNFKKQLKKVFPTAITGEKRLSVNKKEIARLCFNNEENYKKLGDLLTMPVFTAAINKAKRLNGVVFIEIPLLFEYGLQDRFDRVIVIKRSLTARIEGVKKRSALSEEEITARINRQFDYDSADLSPYIVIDNDGDKKELKENIKKALKEITSVHETKG